MFDPLEDFPVNYGVEIAGVDGKPLAIQAERAATALKFLAKFDHEGSSVSLRITSQDAEKIYQLLSRLSEETS